jgi:hypothetical protein
MYIFAEPVTEEQADALQNQKLPEQRAFERDIVGINQSDPEMQKEWQDIQKSVDNEVDEDGIREVKENEEVDDTEEDEAVVAENEDTTQEKVIAGENEGTTEEEAIIEENEGSIEEEAVVRENQYTTEEDVAIRQEEGTIEEEAVAEENEGTIEEEADAGEDKDTAEESGAVEGVVKEELEKPATRPLMGWTLAVRSRVNGVYVERPVDLTAEDDWTVEYHIKEIAADARQNLYNKVTEERHKTIGLTEEERGASLQNYRRVIKTFSTRGRAWREKQNKVDEHATKQIFRPLGPGSEASSESKD